MKDRRLNGQLAEDFMTTSAFRAAELGSRELLDAYLVAVERLSSESQEPLCAILLRVDCPEMIGSPVPAYDIVGGIMLDECRLDDVACRYNDQSFVIILTNVELDTAKDIAQRYRRSVMAFSWEAIEPLMSVKVLVEVIDVTKRDTVYEATRRIEMAFTDLAVQAGSTQAAKSVQPNRNSRHPFV